MQHLNSLWTLTPEEMMDKKNRFYVTIPSNPSAHIYLNMKTWNYRTKLAKLIILNEAAVTKVRLTFPESWHNGDCLQYKKIKELYSNTFCRLMGEIIKWIQTKYPFQEMAADINIFHNAIANKVYIVDPEGTTFTELTYWGLV